MKPRYHYRKKIKYYVFTFIAASVALLLYGLYENRGDLSVYWDWAGDFFLYPFFITFFIYIYHNIVGRFKFKLEKQNREQRFVLEISKAVNEELNLDPETIDSLRSNEKFQDVIFKAYQVYLHGEDEKMSYASLEKNFRHGTEAHAATMIIIDKVKALRKKEKDSE